MECTYPGRMAPDIWFWAASADPEEAPDPAVLARTAIETMNLRAISIGSYPHTNERSAESMGVVGWHVWLWVSGASASTFGPITKSASAGGYTVTATAQVTEVVWDMGNGDTVSCGKGTQYTGMGKQNVPSPTCGYLYEKDGYYEISATSHWEITWSGIGQTGTIEMELTSLSEQLSIAEVQVVNIPIDD
ncbi:hypothetical protein LKO27_12355 [Tessaracoccus sp. OS52]|uniref:hypothetical protein n=1 Tax=Tessaracoccus sp. OS52 TaxID=2886691 RepID=UPI001D10845D|nr:hypothetical protein [Tessaracoccus sp. OS52]MCC2594199.1 hypothetical protein [Tessaracoccus sp. OS52]